MNTKLEALKIYNFDKQLKKLEKKYKNKKVILYGAGRFFYFIMNNYDFSRLNIIAVSDIKYKDINEDSTDSYTGYKVISPQKIHSLKPDIVLLTLENIYFAEKYFCEDLFIETRKKFKYKPILTLPLSAKIQSEWDCPFFE